MKPRYHIAVATGANGIKVQVRISDAGNLKKHVLHDERFTNHASLAHYLQSIL